MENLKVSKRKPLPARERGIGKRLREAREGLRLSQQEFAAQVGITRQRLASYEELRAPIRFDLALKICRQFVISEKWLATGKGAVRACCNLVHEGGSYQIPVDTPFGKAFDATLGKIYESISRETGGAIPVWLYEGDGIDLIKNWFLYAADHWFDSRRQMPKDFAAQFFYFLLGNGNAYFEFVLKNQRLPTEKDFEVRIEPPRNK